MTRAITTLTAATSWEKSYLSLRIGMEENRTTDEKEKLCDKVDEHLEGLFKVEAKSA